MSGTDAWVPATTAEMIGLLEHHDRSQLLYQVREIIEDRLYLQHGIEVRPGDVVFDVGANVGVSAAFFAAGCGATVHSFEPVGPTFEILRATTRSLPGCHTHNVGLSSRRRTAEITYYPRADAMSGLYADPDLDAEFTRQCYLNSGVDEAEADRRLAGLYEPVRLSCELRTLSEVKAELGIDVIDLLKIDVERSELEVLDGIDAGDWPRIRQVVVEVHDEDGRLAAVEEALATAGFELVREQEPAMVGTELYLLYGTRP